jgi:monofunctional biosynthetic peptidoglycan transglycosylase
MLHHFRHFLLLTIGGFVVASILVVALYREVPPPATPLMLIRSVEGRGLTKSWRPLDAISPHLIRAVLAGEDQKFCEHHGFDWNAIREAWRRYRQGNGKLRGASTVSMQTAKTFFCGPGATG